MGNKKKKIVIKKIENKGSRAVTFTKRRKGLYAKASELCLLSGAKMAILVTPLSSNSNYSFFSFGHSSVDSVVSAFLANQAPLEEEENEEEDDIAQRGLGFWWEDESLAQSNDPEKLRVAIDSITKMLNDLNKFRSEAVENREKLTKKKKKGVRLQELAQTLNIESTSANLVGFNKNKEEQDQTEAITYKNGLPENFDGWCNLKQDLKAKHLEMDDVSMVTTTNQTPSSDSKNVEDLALMIQKDLSGEEFYLDQFIETNPTGLLMDIVSNQNLCSEYETAGAMVVNHKDLDEDNLKFSDYFNDLPSITTL